MGPELAHHLDGSERAKERLEMILETIAGRLTIRQACDRLGIEQAMFFRLRMQALQAGIDRLEPRPAGRPAHKSSPEEERIVELSRELQRKESELKATEVRLEVAQVLPQVIEGETAKKKRERQQRRKPPRQRRQRRRKRPR
jgi:hypothetical protein